MKKKLLFITLMVAMLICIFAIVSSAETPSMYIEFSARFEGSDEYVTVYTQNAESSGNPRVNLNNDFYSDLEFTNPVDKTKITGIDFSNAVSHNTSSTVNRITRATDPSVYANCKEVKWFSTGFTTFMASQIFKDWTGLKTFDFGCLTSLGDNDFQNTGFENLVIPSTVKKFSNSTFSSCASLQTVKFEGQLESIGLTSFYKCTALKSVDMGPNTFVGSGMFRECTNLATVTFDNASNVTEIKSEAFYGCKALNMNYIFTNVTSIGSSAFRSSATNEGCELILSFPNIVTLGGSSGDTHVFTDSGVKELYFGNTIKNIGFNTFTRCTKLWKAEFAGPVTNFNFGVYTFEDCTALKTFSIPEGITTLPARMFRNCTGLTAVYLPSTLTTINSGDQEHATFFNCQKMYFVSEPFSIESETSALPAKPDVYFFPTGITSVSTGEIFKLCKSLNKTLVFPTGVTEIANAFAFEAATSDVTLENIVFLGDMTKVATSNNNKYWDFKGKIYFANSADKSSENVALGGIGGDAVFCHADGNTTHLQNPKAPTSQGATCLEGAMIFKTCFCNTKFDITNDESNPALGHDYDFSTITAMTYADYTKDGVITCGCHRADCEGVKAEVVKNTHLFTYNGYSRNDEGDMCVGYIVNAEFLEYYKAINTSFSFGLVGTVIDFDENGMIQGEDNPLAPDYAGKIMKADLTDNTGLVGYDMRITGFGEAYKDLFLAMNLYVIDGESTSYIWDGAEGGTNTVVNYKQYSALSVQ